MGNHPVEIGDGVTRVYLQEPTCYTRLAVKLQEIKRTPRTSLSSFVHCPGRQTLLPRVRNFDDTYHEVKEVDHHTGCSSREVCVKQLPSANLPQAAESQNRRVRCIALRDDD